MHPSVHIVSLAFAAKLYPGIHSLRNFEFKLNNKITVVLFGNYKRVGLSGYGSAYDLTVLYFVFSVSVKLFPALQVFALNRFSQPDSF